MPFIHVVKLRQIQSKIQRTVFRVDVDHTSRSPEDRAREDTKVANIRQDLEMWLVSIPEPPPVVEGGPHWMYQPENNTFHDSRDFFTLQYHKTVLSLYTSLLPGLAVGEQRFVSCAQSAARICATYKRLNQQKILSFTIIGLHSCFVAGLTLVYCLWRDKSLFNFDILEATRACSQCLTIFGEKWPGAVRFGDIFEALSSSVLRAIIEPTQNGAHDLRIDLEMLVEPTVSSNETHLPSVPDPLLGAVKEVFMDVNEDSSGGWQGWRVFTEMVQSGIQDPSLATGGITGTSNMTSTAFTAPNWGDGSNFENEDLDMSGVQFGGTNYAQGNWEHSFFAGYD